MARVIFARAAQIREKAQRRAKEEQRKPSAAKTGNEQGEQRKVPERESTSGLSHDLSTRSGIEHALASVIFSRWVTEPPDDAIGGGGGTSNAPVAHHGVGTLEPNHTNWVNHHDNFINGWRVVFESLGASFSAQLDAALDALGPAPPPALAPGAASPSGEE